MPDGDQDKNKNAEANEKNKAEANPLSEDTLKGKDTTELVNIITNMHSKILEVNAESKGRRLKLEKFEAAEKTKTEADLEAKELIKVRDNEIAGLKADRARDKLASRATTDLVEAGFPQKFVAAAIPKDLTDDNYADAIKTFKTDFKEFKSTTDKSDPPDPRQNDHVRRDDSKALPDGMSLAQAAEKEIREVNSKKGK